MPNYGQNGFHQPCSEEIHTWSEEILGVSLFSDSAIIEIFAEETLTLYVLPCQWDQTTVILSALPS